MTRNFDRRFLAHLALALFAFAAHGESETPPRDPYDQPAYMPDGPHKGEPIDTSERRPVLILPPEVAKLYGAREGDTVIANFYYGDRHWIARVPPKFMPVIPQEDKFPKPEKGPYIPASHAMFRAPTLPDDQILIYPQTAPPASPEELPAPRAVNGVNFTAEAVGVKGWKYDLIKGMNKDTVIVLRAVGSDTVAQKKITEQKRLIAQFIASLPPDVQAEYPLAYMELSNRWGYTKMYHTLFQNCDTVQFCILDDLMKDRYSMPRKLFVRMMKFVDAYPVWLKQSFRIRGIKTTDIPSWNEELQTNACRPYLREVFQTETVAPTSADHFQGTRK